MSRADPGKERALHQEIAALVENEATARFEACPAGAGEGGVALADHQRHVIGVGTEPHTAVVGTVHAGPEQTREQRDLTEVIEARFREPRIP